MKRTRAILCIVLAATTPSCGAVRPANLAVLGNPVSMQWNRVQPLQDGLPHGIHVFAGRSEVPPINAWYVLIEGAGTRFPVSIEVAADEATRRETVSSFANRLGACVVVNGGYFTMNQTPAVSYGLFVADNQLRGPATDTVIRDSRVYPTARAAIGVTETGGLEIVWATSRGDTVFAWDAPPPNSRGRPAELSEHLPARRWTIEDALGVGPMLVREGRQHITSNEEGFFGTSIPDRHPRTAAGITHEGDLILMVVDGRQEVSIGVTLEELAQFMIEAGARDALNLDGGGSSTLVVNQLLVNQPQGMRGQTVERAVKNAVTVFCD